MQKSTLLYLFTATAVWSVVGNEVYKAKNGMTCLVCPKGFFFVSDCIQNMTTSVCRLCDPGTYNSEPGIPQSCSNCGTYCKDINSYMYKNCSTTENIQCRCRTGYFKEYKVKDDEKTWYCKRHSSCPPGSGVEHVGTAHQDTVCKSCIDGTFSNSSSTMDECHKCTECQDLDRSIKCNGINDTVCVSVIDIKGNKDHRTDEHVIKIVVPVICLLAVFFLVLLPFCIWHVNRKRKWCWKQQEEEKSPPVSFIQAHHNSNETGNAVLVTDGPDDKVEHLNNGSNQETEAPQKPTWDRLFSELSPIIISNWKSVIRELFGEGGNEKIVEAEHNHMGDVKEQIYFCLNKWRQSLKCKPTIQPVLIAIKTHIRDQHVHKKLGELQMKYSSL